MAEFSIVFSSNEKGIAGLIEALEIFKNATNDLKHIESRQSQSGSEAIEYLIKVHCSTEQFLTILWALRRNKYSVIHSSLDVPWFPKYFSELKVCAGALYKYGSQLTSDHPGYGDREYEERRAYFADIASNYRLGEPIPRVQYTDNETGAWKVVYTHQQQFYPTHACQEHNYGIKLLEEHCGYSATQIPQLEDVSQFLQSQTGYRLCPVVGWIHSRDFLALLAFRVFPCTQYIRHHAKPRYTPEPDICHELLGHVPLFCNPEFADFSQELGLASLGASDEWITKLSTLYWFTVEFGMTKENGEPKAFGAGLLSSCEELEYCVGDAPERLPFNCEQAVVCSYPETGLQPLYFVAENLEDVKNKMKDFSRLIEKPFSINFNKENCSVAIS